MIGTRFAIRRDLIYASLSPDGSKISSYSIVGEVFIFETGIAPDLFGQTTATRDNRTIYFTRDKTEADIWLLEVR